MRYIKSTFITLFLFSTISSVRVLSQESPRITPTVKLIEQIEPCVVTIFAKSDNAFGVGSGTFIHPDGFILTNFHVVQRLDGFVVLPNGNVAEYRYIGGVPERDIAIVKANLSEPAQAIHLGRSHDVRNGEPIISAGNPGGRGIVFSSGIVSSKGIMTDAGNVLVMSQFRASTRDLAIQFDAASNRGNSGGPLVNAEGKQIGVVASKNFEEENINFAIPIDRVRSIISTALAAEPMGDLWAGVVVDYLSDAATVVEVADGSPADEIGLQAGDVLLSWNKKALVTGIDWDLMLLSSKTGDEVELAWSRESVVHESKLKLGSYQTSSPASAPAPKESDLEPGLDFQVYHLTQPTAMPDFASLKAVRNGTSDGLDLAKLTEGRVTDFAIVYEGYIRIDNPGVYRLSITSDDGSMLYVNDKLFVDHNGNHPAYERGRIERFACGNHRVRIEFFQGKGDLVLSLGLEEAGTKKPVSVPIKFFRDRKVDDQ